MGLSVQRGLRKHVKHVCNAQVIPMITCWTC